MGGFNPNGISPPIRWAAVMAITASLTACGGGGGSGGATVAVAPTPSPTPSPSPSPSPTPTPTPTPGPTVASIGAPALAFAPATPASPQATAGGPTFATQPTVSINFPVLQSTLALSNGVLAADTATMNAGSSFDFAYCSGCRETFALNVPSLGLSGVSLNTYADTPFFATLGDGRQVRVEEATWGVDDLKWIKFGYWEIGTGFPTNYSAYVYGYETPLAALPTSGTATYFGQVSGRVFYPGAAGFGRTLYLDGLARVQIDFAARTATGLLYSLIAPDGQGAVSQFNDVTFAVSFPAGQIAGTTAVSTAPANADALGAGAQGTVAARFYGSNASELGLVFTLYDGTRAAVGSSGVN